MSRLPTESVTLLQAAQQDPNGIIMWFVHMSGENIQTNGHNFTEGADARVLATWRDAIQRLIQAGFITRVGSGNLYQITKAGYDYLDLLAQSVK